MAQRHWAWNTALFPRRLHLPGSPLTFSSPFSITLLNFTLPPIFSFAVSYTLSWSSCYFLCLQPTSFIFPLQPNYLGSYSPNLSFTPPISSFICTHLVLFHVFALFRDFPVSIGQQQTLSGTLMCSWKYTNNCCSHESSVKTTANGHHQRPCVKERVFTYKSVSVHCPEPYFRKTVS